ncbi:hypothetical protein ASG54_17815 [Aureimonas sp. Leaf460]|nr:hypothetical protein ASG62_16540 [Aureimonas sp. Leaf427]KQT73237.1 hypothetical protein ASG54_17815 [Aureimonas sp. Leaf460]
MSRSVYVLRDGKLVEKSKALRSDGPFFMRDIDPYESPITGETITSRSQRREEMKRHDCIDARDLKGTLLANGKRHRG